MHLTLWNFPASKALRPGSQKICFDGSRRGSQVVHKADQHVRVIGKIVLRRAAVRSRMAVKNASFPPASRLIPDCFPPASRLVPGCIWYEMFMQWFG